ncbi:MAG: glycosyltransferase family 4 protein, partial [Candidatus Aegiribacteria sp.]|nr:glycosyltransferase family 4 protein [Candidatus Aegiribacteria sp.]
MDIGFDATNILGHGGIKTYARELIRGLAEQYPDDSFILLTTFSGSKKRKLEEIFGDLPNITVRKSVPHRNMLGDGLFCVTKFLSGILWRLSSRSLDIVHLTDPFGSVVLPRKFVATVHDIFPITLDEFKGSGLRCFYLSRTPEILEKARAVITPSDYVQKSLQEYFPESRCPIVPVSEAASDGFHPRGRNGEILKRCGLDKHPYYLFVGRVDPRKNIPRLIDAYLELPEGIRSKNLLALVLSGRPPDIEGFRNRHCHLLEGKGIVYLRDVPQKDLYNLYSSALAFVFPTLDEGFGLPVLEAMQSGCPVIASDLSCIPEIAGDAAILVDPCDISALSKSMKLLDESPGKRKEYIGRSLERAACFSWA